MEFIFNIFEEYCGILCNDYLGREYEYLMYLKIVIVKRSFMIFKEIFD